MNEVREEEEERECLAGQEVYWFARAGERALRDLHRNGRQNE